MWIDIPDTEAILAEVPRPDHDLVVYAEMLADSDDRLDRAAAVGLLARLGAWCSRDPEIILERLRAGEAGPVSVALAWARSLSPDQAVTLGCFALDEAIHWKKQAEVEAGKDGSQHAMLLAFWRDRIESACWVLAAAGRHADVHAIRQCCVWPKELPRVPEGEALLDAVREAEPWADW